MPLGPYYRVERKYANDLVPGQVNVWLPSHYLAQGLRDEVGTVVRFLDGVGLAGETACERVMALRNWIAPIDLASHELADGD